MAIELWKNLGLSWSEVLPERSSKEDFLSRKVKIILVFL